VKLEGDYRFDATVRDVWDALFDPAVLAAAMPGCEKLDEVDGAFVGEMTIKVGPITSKLTGKVDVSDKVEPERYRMVIDGRGPQGFVKATAAIALAADGDGTKLHYDADAQIGGKLASVGQRLIDASARAITKQALDNLHENVKRRAAAKVTPAAEPPVYEQADAGDMAKAVAKEVGKTMLPVILIVAAVILLIVWLLLR
jgi:uncharacterized protein